MSFLQTCLQLDLSFEGVGLGHLIDLLLAGETGFLLGCTEDFRFRPHREVYKLILIKVQCLIGEVPSCHKLTTSLHALRGKENLIGKDFSGQYWTVKKLSHIRNNSKTMVLRDQ